MSEYILLSEPFGAGLKPEFVPHDCDSCVFVGAEYRRGDFATVADLYVHGRFGQMGFAIVRRTSSEPADATCAALDALDQYPWALMVLKQMARGYLSLDGRAQQLAE